MRQSSRRWNTVASRAPNPTERQSKLAEYHQAVNFYFASLKPGTEQAEIDAAIAKIAKETGI